MNKKNFNFIVVPSIVLFVILTTSILELTNFPEKNIINGIQFIGIIIGSIQLINDTIKEIFKKSLALDYIAILAIVTSLITGEFFVALIIVLMLSGGNALEKYAMLRATDSLSSLKNRIPSKIRVIESQNITVKNIESVEIGEIVLVRKGEVVPLDGILLDSIAVLDEQSLTGESMPVTKLEKSLISSGVINLGETIKIKVTKTSEDSTFKKIIQLVQMAQETKAPFVRLANKYSFIFTLLTLSLELFWHTSYQAEKLKDFYQFW